MSDSSPPQPRSRPPPTAGTRATKPRRSIREMDSWRCRPVTPSILTILLVSRRFDHLKHRSPDEVVKTSDNPHDRAHQQAPRPCAEVAVNPPPQQASPTQTRRQFDTCAGQSHHARRQPPSWLRVAHRALRKRLPLLPVSPTVRLHADRDIRQLPTCRRVSGFVRCHAWSAPKASHSTTPQFRLASEKGQAAIWPAFARKSLSAQDV